jgi:purine-binding chemotaxis protein CheW
MKIAEAAQLPWSIQPIELAETAGTAMRVDAGDAVSLCSLRAGTGLFAIDTRQIREVLGKARPQTVPLAPAYIAGVLPYRGEALTTVCLRSLLGLERWAGASCVLVLDDEEEDERFGLMVDGVGGVVTMGSDALEANPSALDARSMALFDGAYRMPAGLMVRLEPRRLRPSRLAESGLFSGARQEREQR